jgi:hypothetical protein
MKSQIHAIALISRQKQKTTQNIKLEAIYREQQRQKKPFASLRPVCLSTNPQCRSGTYLASFSHQH